VRQIGDGENRPTPQPLPGAIPESSS
jgi:hypothetical protein